MCNRDSECVADLFGCPAFANVEFNIFFVQNFWVDRIFSNVRFFKISGPPQFLPCHIFPAFAVIHKFVHCLAFPEIRGTPECLICNFFPIFMYFKFFRNSSVPPKFSCALFSLHIMIFWDVGVPRIS